MSESMYKQLERERKGFKVMIEFPDKSDDETVIHEEVKQILSNLLREQILSARHTVIHALQAGPQ